MAEEDQHLVDKLGTSLEDGLRTSATNACVKESTQLKFNAKRDRAGENHILRQHDYISRWWTKSNKLGKQKHMPSAHFNTIHCLLLSSESH